VSLAGRVALITGADGGLGRTLCQTFNREGADVVPVDLRGENCFHADVGTAEGNRAMVDEAMRRHGQIDVLVLNAGLQRVAPIAEYEERDWDQLMNVMAKGPFLAIKFAWPTLARRAGGRIIAIGSVLSVTADAHKPAYVAAKHAVLGLIRVAALEGAPLGLTANVVAPGWMHTPIVENQLNDLMRLRHLSREELVAEIVGSQPGKRFVETGEVAELVAFLASEKASGMNGAFLPVDLGTLSI
jgi:3-hydroxybutyrate dehydrogenase